MCISLLFHINLSPLSIFLKIFHTLKYTIPMCISLLVCHATQTNSIILKIEKYSFCRSYTNPMTIPFRLSTFTQNISFFLNNLSLFFGNRMSIFPVSPSNIRIPVNFPTLFAFVLLHLFPFNPIHFFPESKIRMNK